MDRGRELPILFCIAASLVAYSSLHKLLEIDVASERSNSFNLGTAWHWWYVPTCTGLGRMQDSEQTVASLLEAGGHTGTLELPLAPQRALFGLCDASAPIQKEGLAM